jgi:hypothetical protein
LVLVRHDYRARCCPRALRNWVLRSPWRHIQTLRQAQSRPTDLSDRPRRDLYYGYMKFALTEQPRAYTELSQVLQNEFFRIITSFPYSQYSVWLRGGRPGDRGSIPGRGERISPVASVSRPALEPTQPPVQQVLGILSPGPKCGRGVTLTTHPIYSRGRERVGDIPPLPPSAFVACSGTALASLQVKAFWDIGPCGLVEVDRNVRGAYCLHHHGDE